MIKKSIIAGCFIVLITVCIVVLVNMGNTNADNHDLISLKVCKSSDDTAYAIVTLNTDTLQLTNISVYNETNNNLITHIQYASDTPITLKTLTRNVNSYTLPPNLKLIRYTKNNFYNIPESVSMERLSINCEFE